MALVDLKTELTSLKFGNDRPGYGSSNAPYIQTQIPGAPGSPGLFRPVYIPGSTGNLDFPIRGAGLNTVSFGQQTFTGFNELDFARIKRFLEDQPRGPLFLRKQVGLQLTNPKIETGNTLFGLGQSAPLPGLLENTRVYDVSGRTTLAQVAAMGSGAHAVRSGLVAFAPGQKYYYDIVNQQNTNNITSINRLVNLNALKMTTGVSPFIDPNNVIDIERVNTLGISLNRNLLFQYLGGPGSVYGAGTTTIKRVVDTTKLRSTKVMTYDRLKSQASNETNLNGKVGYKIQDFRQQLPGLAGTYKPWGKNTIDERFFVAAGNYRDKMNLLYPFAFNNSVAPWEFNKAQTDDLIKFVFEAISNDNPSYSLAIFFRAFLTAGITDSHNAELNSFKYLGRGENFYTYQGFNRAVSFAFRIAAGSKDELRPIYNKLNALVSQVYPDYSPQNIMRAPIVRLTIGDYFNRVPGFIESINITVDNGSPWEINLDGDSAQLPQVVDVSVSFRPILDVLPKRSRISDTLITNNQTQLGSNIQDNSLTTETTTGTILNTPLIANSTFTDGDTFIKQKTPTSATISRVATGEEARAQRIAEGYDVDLMAEYGITPR
jgi:hypothetical protein